MKRPAPGSRPKIITKAEVEELDRRREATRLGAVAAHHGKAISDCPYPESDPRHLLWKEKFSAVRNRKGRMDMTPARANGIAAFNDGLYPHECPLPGRDPKRSEWMDGYEFARKQHEKREKDLYR